MSLLLLQLGIACILKFAYLIHINICLSLMQVHLLHRRYSWIETHQIILQILYLNTVILLTDIYSQPILFVRCTDIISI
jgi:hypothetical protein